MDKETKKYLIDNYRTLFFKHGDKPEAVQWSCEGQQFRFNKLTQIADLRDKRILDVGCGKGDMYPFLFKKFGNVDYTGVDIVPESLAYAAQKYPQATFYCRDLLEDVVDEKFDYTLISGVFNNSIPKSSEFLRELVTAAFKQCELGIGFNFLSTYVNYTNADMAYHDPIEVFDFCLKTLSPNVMIHHHYERCDVVIFVYR